MVSAIKTKLGFLSRLPKFNIPSSFLESFAKGMGVFVLCSIGLFVWTSFNKDNALVSLQSLTPSKTVTLELPDIKVPVTKDPDVETASQNILAPAPIDGFFLTENGLNLPIRNQDGNAAFDAYKKQFTPMDGHAIISIVVVDFGLSEKMSQLMIQTLPKTITLALTPYTLEAQKWMDNSRKSGYETWLTLPLQSKNSRLDDVGDLTILKNSTAQQNLTRLKNVLGIVTGYSGLVTTKEHDFEDKGNSLSSLIQDIQTRGLGFVEVNEDYAPIGLAEFAKEKSPFVQNDFWLDANLKPEGLQASFVVLEQKAKRDGHVIAFTHPYPSVLAMISTWSKDLESKNLQLAPLSSLIQQK